MSPLVLGITVVATLLVLCLPRPASALGVFVAICYVTQGQTLDVAGFHFTAIRIVLLAGLLRATVGGEFKTFRYNGIDKSVVVFCLYCAAISILREHSSSAVVYQFGTTYNILIPYFFARTLFRNCDDIKAFLPLFALLITPLAVIMSQEAVAGHNAFYSMGGVPEYVELRTGHYRCQAAFRSPITAGTFGATFMPFFVGLYLSGKSRTSAVLGFVSATFIMIFSHSSGPLIAYVTAIICLLGWPLRQRMQTIRRVFTSILIFLHLVMKAPVWFLMARVSDLLGGGGYHRAEIVDQFVNHFRSWLLMGMSDTGDWIAYQLEDGTADLTNQFVVSGVTGGLVGLILFIRVFVRCFRNIGLAMKKVRADSPAIEKLLWALGAALFATVVNFFSVSYFDQIGVVFYILVAIVASVTTDLLETELLPVQNEEFGQSSHRPVFRGSGLAARVAAGNTHLAIKYS